MLGQVVVRQAITKLGDRDVANMVVWGKTNIQFGFDRKRERPRARERGVRGDVTGTTMIRILNRYLDLVYI